MFDYYERTYKGPLSLDIRVGLSESGRPLLSIVSLIWVKSTEIKAKSPFDASRYVCLWISFR